MRAATLLLCAALGAACAPDPLDTPALEAALATTRQAPGAEDVAGPPPTVPMWSATGHRLSLLLHYRLDSDDGESTRLSVRRTIDREPDGRFRIEESRDWSDARHRGHAEQTSAMAIYDGRRFVVRHGWGPWRARETWAGQHWEMLTGSYALIGELFDAYAPYIAPKQDEGLFFVAGIAAKAFQLHLDKDVLPKALSAEALAALRDHDTQWVRWLTATHQPVELRGWVMRSVADDSVLVGELVAVGFAKEGTESSEYRLTLEASVGDIPPANPIAIPAKADIHPARRPRLWSMIEDVVGDRLEPIYRRAARQP